MNAQHQMNQASGIRIKIAMQVCCECFDPVSQGKHSSFQYTAKAARCGQVKPFSHFPSADLEEDHDSHCTQPDAGHTAMWPDAPEIFYHWAQGLQSVRDLASSLTLPMMFEFTPKYFGVQPKIRFFPAATASWFHWKLLQSRVR